MAGREGFCYLVFIETGKFCDDRVRSWPRGCSPQRSSTLTCWCLCTGKQLLWHLCCSTPARSWREGAQTCRLPQSPAGSPITPTQTPAVKHVLLTRSSFLSYLVFYPVVIGFSFCITRLPPPSHFSLIAVSSHSAFPLLFGFPGIVPTWCFTPTLAIRGFISLWGKQYGQAGTKADWIGQILVQKMWEKFVTWAK